MIITFFERVTRAAAAQPPVERPALPEVVYGVTKHFRLTTDVRNLRLTSAGIENCVGTVATSVHSYDSVVRIRLKDMRHILIEYDRGHPYHYESDVAMEIIQEICSRIGVRAYVERPDLRGGTDLGLEFQKKLVSGPGSAAETPAEGSAVSAPDPAAPLGPGSVSPPPRSAVSAPSSPLTGTASALDTSRPRMRTDLASKPSRLTRLTGMSDTQRLGIVVDKIIQDPELPEGRTLRKFLANYNIYEKNHATVASNLRMFLDGMKEHLLTHRAADLLRSVSEMAASEQVQTSLAEVVELCLERAVLSPLYRSVIAAVGEATRCVARLRPCRSRDNPLMFGPCVVPGGGGGGSAQDAAIARNIRLLADKPQSFFEVPYVSPSEYAEAVRELSRMEALFLPCEKMAVIMATSRCIYATVNAEQNARRPAHERKTVFLSADDFLPILIFVLVRCGSPHYARTCEFLSVLSDPAALRSEAGYYLTAFASAVQYIQTLDADRIRSAEHV